MFSILIIYIYITNTLYICTNICNFNCKHYKTMLTRIHKKKSRQERRNEQLNINVLISKYNY